MNYLPKTNKRISTFLDRKLKECINNIDGVFNESFSQKDCGFDVALTTQRLPVQFWPGPYLNKTNVY